MHVVPFISGALCVLYSLSFGNEKPSDYRAYEQQLSHLVLQDKQLREQIALEQARISDCKLKITESKKRIEALREQKYSHLSINQAYAIHIAEQLSETIQSAEKLLQADNNLFAADTTRISAFGQMIATLQENPVHRLPKIHKQINTLQNVIKLLVERKGHVQPPPVAVEEQSAIVVPENSSNVYTVSPSSRKAETLYGIALKVYGDPYKWTLIYKANKEVIDSIYRKYSHSKKSPAVQNASDFILPGLVLVIPR